MTRIYLDYNSTTPTLPAVVEAMRPYFESTFGNPASPHRSGAVARAALEQSRGTVAACLGAQPDEVYFTSGATEANNLALFGLAGGVTSEILISPVEHPSVVEPVKQLAEAGWAVGTLAVDQEGRVRPDCFSDSVSNKTGLVTVQLANHETGVLQDVAALESAAPGIPFHTDATQAVAKTPVSFQSLGVSTLACSGHKVYGPKGVGVLLVRRGVRLRPRVFGGHQQQGIRPGTEAVPLAVGFATALELAVREMDHRTTRVIRLRQRLLDVLRRQAEPVVINGEGLPHALNVSFPGCPSDMLLIRLDLSGVDCSTGSACSSGSLLPSPVLQAMNSPPECLHSAMRFSVSHLMTEEQIDEAGRRIAREVTALRRSGVPSR